MKTDQGRLTEFYKEYIKNHPDGGGWPSKEYATEVYTGVTNSLTIPWSKLDSILDVGCAIGNFLPFIRTEKKFAQRYTGIEVFHDFYKDASTSFTEDKSAEFINGDFLAHDFGTKKFDWIFCIGALGTMNDNKDEYDKAFIEKMIGLSKKGFTLYVNDRAHFDQERLKRLKDLYAHDIESVKEILHVNNIKSSQIDVVNYPKDKLVSCSINVHLSSH